MQPKISIDWVKLREYNTKIRDLVNKYTKEQLADKIIQLEKKKLNDQ